MLIAPDAAVLAAFVAASLALNLTPGADMMFSIASGAAGGPRAAVAASLGINLGVVVHIAMAAAGRVCFGEAGDARDPDAQCGMWSEGGRVVRCCAAASGI